MTECRLSGLFEELTNNITNPSSDIMGLRGILVRYKEMGISKTEMLDCLAQLRDRGLEDREDTILDLMDFVTGFCNPTLKIYND